MAAATGLFLFIHSERLHEEHVWNAIARYLDTLKNRGHKALFFVYPFRGLVQGYDVSGRVRHIHASGCEVGQHTHFYHGRELDPLSKQNDLSDSNVERCLQRDFDFLSSAGEAPKSFTSGGWCTTAYMYDILARLGFRWDASRLLSRTSIEQSIPCIKQILPRKIWTTSSLGQWFRGGNRRFAHTNGSGAYKYRAVYLHDYDLAQLKYRLLLDLFLKVNLQSLGLPDEELKGD